MTNISISVLLETLSSLIYKIIALFLWLTKVEAPIHSKSCTHNTVNYQKMKHDLWQYITRQCYWCWLKQKYIS